jgi:hypothetical protein
MDVEKLFLDVKIRVLKVNKTIKEKPVQPKVSV